MSERELAQQVIEADAEIERLRSVIDVRDEALRALTADNDRLRVRCQEQGVLDGNQITRLRAQRDELVDEVKRLRTIEALYAAGKDTWEPVYKIVLDDRDRLRAIRDELVAAAENLLAAFAIGPLDAAAKYGPDVDLREIEDAAFDALRAAIAKAKEQP
jgi:hypothetical protein